MPKKENLINQKFNRLTVIAEASSKNKKTYWKCKCDCGKIIEARTDSLKSGKIKSCGCLNTETRSKLGKSNIQDITNQKFGRLTALKRLENRQSNSLGYDWECICECGNHVIVPITYLKSGNTLSCGCLKNSLGEQEIAKLLISLNIKFETQKSFENLISQRNKKLKFDFYLSDQNILIEFDGPQHYKQTNFTTIDGIKNDQLKNEWSIINQIPLYRIPYSELKNISKWKSLNDIQKKEYLVQTINHYNFN